MFRVGNVSDADWKLCEVNKAARDAAIAACGPGVPINRIGQVSSFLMMHMLTNNHAFAHTIVVAVAAHVVQTILHDVHIDTNVAAAWLRFCQELSFQALPPGSFHGRVLQWPTILQEDCHV